MAHEEEQYDIFLCSDLDSMLNGQDLMSSAISQKELNSSTKVGELGDKLKHMEMKDILDIDLDMEN